MSRTLRQLLDCLALRSFATSGSTFATPHRHVSDDLQHHPSQWRTQEFCSGGWSTNSAEDRKNGDLGAVAP
jgi:hypothetical protein